MSQHKILIGYLPLFDPTRVMHRPGQTFDVDLDKLGALLKDALDSETDNTTVYGVLWVSDQDRTVTPLLIIDNAKAICDHLRSWSEEEWDRFFVKAVQKPEGYAIALIPDKDKSILRWQTARLIFHDQLSADTNFTVIYQYLGVFCPTDRLGLISGKIKPKTMLGFIDKSQVADIESAIYLGPFDFKLEDDSHLDKLFPQNDKEADTQ